MSIDAAAYDSIALERVADDRVLRIDLDRPGRHNILDLELIAELNDAVSRADTAPDVNGIIFGSTSDDVFCAGADVGELSGLDAEESSRFLSIYNDTVDLFWSTGKPVVAAVSGDCVAGGNELVMGCDLIVAGDSSRFGQPEATVGSTAAGGGVQMMPLMVGMQRAKDLLLTGRLLSASEAEEWGLINRVVPDEAVDERAVELVTEIVNGKSPYAYRVMKAIFKHWYNDAMAAREIEREVTAAVWTDEEFRERAAAFLEGEGLDPRDFSGTTGSVED